MEYLGRSRFWGSGKRGKKGSFGWHYRWRDEEGRLWELRVWEEEGAVRGDEDEAPCVLLRDGEEVGEFGSLEEFRRKVGFPMDD
jgi:hypothetical protein